MGVTQMYLLMGMMVIILLYLMFVLYRRKHIQKGRAFISQKRKKTGRNYLYHFYILFTTIPGFKKYFQKTRNRIADVYPADDMAVNMRTTSIILRAMIICAVVIAVSIMAAGGDFFFIFAGITITYLLFLTLVDGRVAGIQTKLMDQLKDFIDQVREQYNRLNRVDDAVSYTLDSLPYEISLHAERIHEILISTDISKALNEYNDMAPNKYLMTFAAIAATTMEFGDKKMKNGESLFLRNLNFLKEEINIELLRRKKSDALFSGLTYVTLIPIIAVKPIEAWAISNMPEIAEYYKGSYGIIAMAFVFLFSAIAYTVVKSLKDPEQDAKTSQESDLSKIVSERPIIARYLNGQVNRNYSKALRYNDMLKMLGDKRGVNAFLVRRYFVGFVGAILMGLVLTTSVIRNKTRQFTDFAQAFDSSIITDDEYRQTMQAVAQDFSMEEYKSGADVMSGTYEKELSEKILSETSIKKEEEADMIAKVIKQRIITYRNTYFKWYYLLAIIGAGVAGYMIPLWIMMFQLRTVQMSMEDEVSQFQTLALILIYVDGIDVIALLEWMERFAFVFKDSISTCIIEFPHKGQKAIQNMMDKETFATFRSICMDLLAVDDVGVEKAFSNIETDREYYKEKRKEDNEIILQKKLTIAKWVSLFPIAFVFCAYMIYPLLKLAMDMMAEINAAAG